MATQNKIKKIGWVALKIALSVLGFWYAFHSIDLNIFKTNIKDTNYGFVLLAIVFYLLSQFVSSLRLKYILSAIDDNVPRIWNAKLYWQGMAYNLFLPGGIGGDAYKTLAYSNRSGKSAKSYILPLLADRLVGLAAIILLLGLCVPFVRAIDVWWKIDWVLIPIAILIFIAYLVVKKLFAAYANIYWKSVFQSIIVQVIQIAAILSIVLTLNIDLRSALSISSFVFLISSIATAIPVFLGGMGAREVVFATMFPMFSIPPSDGVWIAVLFSFVVIISSLPGLFLGFSKDA